MLRRAAAEFFGTFALVFVGTGAMVVNDVLNGVVGHVGIALAFGLIVMAMIYSIGEISGAHINPAVTLGFWAARRFKGREVLPFIGAQLGGAVVASLLLLLMFGQQGTMGGTLPSHTVQQAFIMEVVITMILMFVILGVSTGSRETGIMAGAAVGGTVSMASLFAGPVCGASMNPARSLGPAVAAADFTHLWLYFAAPAVGALLAVPLSSLIHNRRIERGKTT